jgi:hypothetical protein
LISSFERKLSEKNLPTFFIFIIIPFKYLI